MADDADPLALLERLDDVAVDRDAADLLDLAAGDRLAVGDQRQRFQRGAGVLGLALGPQPRDPGVHVGLHLEAEAGGDLDQFDAASVRRPVAQRFERAFDAAVGRGLVQREQAVQLRQGQRLVGREQRGFDDAGDEGLVHREIVQKESVRASSREGGSQ